MRVFIALGSNLGNCQQNLNHAIAAIHQCYPVIAQSSVVKTKAQYIEDQPDFYNQVIEVQGHGDAYELLEFLSDLEVRLGRKRTIKYGPRIIDLDIIFFDEAIINSDKLKIPHPLYHERLFVLRPLLEIAPDLICPQTKMPIRNMLDDLQRMAACV
ncbi:2-amino-4-hydroxy-6-hydroxymethyldihydropteridine diphosphokinase [Candidatus Odyssella thessalonicensis]|uniref:2-amino-4-hydroxy-6- hydroxymethyldihydropteridine diphosphokinase n=1 Tax=Candidatus Odyssella thessalonicensis TaxID=84647 RepID=UPI000225C16A|nr:2-amino-4-hydroxy-6-hydroxymethyldihydropteridine diphosphokinase [Candidatus Odyssella thessalonicensis]